MTKRKLKRQLNLVQVFMLGTIGTISAEIFVLTGHAAGIAGPDAVLALVLGGVMTLSIALNYCELGTTFPVTGGAMTYVGEAFGKGWLMFLVGSLDCLSSAFYAALSAFGFAISLNLFFPSLPIIPVAIGVILVVGLTHMRGVTNAGNLQIVLGVGLLLVFGIFIVKGLTSPQGFQMETFLSGKSILENQGTLAFLGRMLTTIALTYNAYVGFEVIVDDAEEVISPNRNIPKGILISLLVATVIYSSVAFVTIGTVDFSQLAGSETALTDAAAKFWPSIGVPVMGAAGIVAALTSVNTAMLSATREAFSLSREHVWPRVFSRLSRWRTPYAAVIFIVLVSSLVAIIGLVDFLSFISSAGYMFVLFFATLAMPKLRKMYPNIERPFKVPLYPLTVILAALSGILIIAFADKLALLFLSAVLAVLSVVYFISQRINAQRLLRNRLEQQEGGGRILIASKRIETTKSLLRLATAIANQQEDTGVSLFSVLKTPYNLSSDEVPALVAEAKARQQKILEELAPIAIEKNVPLHTKIKAASRVEEGIYAELRRHKDVNLVLLAYPKDPLKAALPGSILKEVLMMADRDVAVLRDTSLPMVIRRILVPVGSGPNAKLALQFAVSIAFAGEARIVVLRLVTGVADEERMEDELSQLHEIVDEELNCLPENIEFKTLRAESVGDGILEETWDEAYDLMIIGAAEEVLRPDQLFGTLDDFLMEEAEVSILVVRRFQPGGAIWLRKQIKRIEQ